VGELGARVSPTAASSNHGQSCVYSKHTQSVTALLKNKLDTKYSKRQERRIEILMYVVYWAVHHCDS